MRKYEKEDGSKLANSKLYFKKGSGEFDEACLPESLVIRTIESVRAEVDPNQTNGDREEMSDLTEFLEGLFGAVMTTGISLDPDRVLSTVFEQLPGYKK